MRGRTYTLRTWSPRCVQQPPDTIPHIAARTLLPGPSRHPRGCLLTTTLNFFTASPRRCRVAAASALAPGTSSWASVPACPLADFAPAIARGSARDPSQWPRCDSLRGCTVTWVTSQHPGQDTAVRAAAASPRPERVRALVRALRGDAARNAGLQGSCCAFSVCS